MEVFTSKGIPSTPQHTAATPAPDRGGPVACLGGPVPPLTPLNTPLDHF